MPSYGRMIRVWRKGSDGQGPLLLKFLQNVGNAGTSIESKLGMKRKVIHLFRSALLMGCCVGFTGCMTMTMYSSTTKEDTHEFVEVPGRAELFRLEGEEVLQATLHPEVPVPDST